MDDDIYDFIEKKRIELEESEKFKEWYKNNKLLDQNGEIVIAFHGSRRKIFDKIEEEKLSVATHLMGGFYLTESVTDAADNYASESSSDYKSFLESDVEKMTGQKIDEESLMELLPEMSNRLSSDLVDELLLMFDDYEDFDVDMSDLEKFGIDKERMIFLNETHQFVNAESSAEEVFNDPDTTFDREEFSKLLLISYKYENDGWVAPFIVKMDKPCVTGFDDEDTIFIIPSMDSDEARALEEESAEEFECYNDVMDIKRTLAFDFELRPSQVDAKFEELLSGPEDTDVESVYEKYIEALVELGVDEEKATEKCREAFEDEAGSYISFDEDGDPEYSSEIYLPDFSIINGDFICEKKELGEEILAALNSNLSVSLEFMDGLFDEEINYEQLMYAFKKHNYEYEEHKEFTSAMGTVFDGVVMNAYKANRESWGNAFDLDYNAKHYIIFNENCIKSAIGNNGEYSLYNNNFVEKRVRKLKENATASLDRNIIEKHIDFVKKEWHTDINIELKDASFFSSKNTKAVLDKSEKNIYINKDSVSSIESLEKTLTHEVVGHLGLNAIFDKNVEKTLLRVANKYKEDMAELNKDYPEYDIKTRQGKLQLAEEFIAKKAEERYPEDGLIKKAKKMLKRSYNNFKRSLGLKTDLAEDVFELLENAKKAVSVNKNYKRRFKR